MQQHIKKRNSVRWIVMSLFIVHSPLFISPVAAQSFTQRLQAPVAGSGTVTIHQDAAIDALVNGPALQPRRQNSNNATPAQQRPTQPTSQQHATEQQGNSQPQANAQQANAQQAAPDSVATGNARGAARRVVGYRIQAFVGGRTRADRQRAEQTGSALRALFPGQKIYVHFYSPRWICRMGNFRTYEEARAMLDEVIRAGYDSATIVRGRITVYN